MSATACSGTEDLVPHRRSRHRHIFTKIASVSSDRHSSQMIDAGTQTSPFNMSRSSSFTYIAEGDLENYSSRISGILLNQSDAVTSGALCGGGGLSYKTASTSTSLLSDSSSCSSCEQLPCLDVKIPSEAGVCDGALLLLSDVSGASSCDEQELKSSAAEADLLRSFQHCTTEEICFPFDAASSICSSVDKPSSAVLFKHACSPESSHFDKRCFKTSAVCSSDDYLVDAIPSSLHCATPKNALAMTSKKISSLVSCYPHARYDNELHSKKPSSSWKSVYATSISTDSGLSVSEDGTLPNTFYGKQNSPPSGKINHQHPSAYHKIDDRPACAQLLSQMIESSYDNVPSARPTVPHMGKKFTSSNFADSRAPPVSPSYRYLNICRCAGENSSSRAMYNRTCSVHYSSACRNCVCMEPEKEFMHFSTLRCFGGDLRRAGSGSNIYSYDPDNEYLLTAKEHEFCYVLPSAGWYCFARKRHHGSVVTLLTMTSPKRSEHFRRHGEGEVLRFYPEQRVLGVLENEATHCCRWLRAAGFPQYAHMYEEHCFPIDIQSVEKEHEFLDRDSLQALFRRLIILNRCAAMNHDTFSPITPDKDSDDEHSTALSANWRSATRRKGWTKAASTEQVPVCCAVQASTGDELRGFLVATRASANPRERRNYQEGFEHEHPSGGLNAGNCSSNCQSISSKFPIAAHLRGQAIVDCKTPGNNNRSDHVGRDSLPSTKLQRSSSERIKDNAKALIRRMELLRKRRRNKKTEAPETHLPGHCEQLDATSLQEVSSASHVSCVYGQESPGSSSGSLQLVSRPNYTMHINSGHKYSTPKTPDQRTMNIDRIFMPTLPKIELDATNYCHGHAHHICANTGDSDLRNEVVHVPLVLYNASSIQPANSQHRKLSSAAPESLHVPDGHLVSGHYDTTDRDSPCADSGVGSSLSRSPSVPSRAQHLRMSSSPKPAVPQLDSLSVDQFSTLQKFSLLKLTAVIEKYSPVNKSSGWNWNVQNFVRKIRSPEQCKALKDRRVFGVPLSVIAQNTGHPLPLCIQQAMTFLQQDAIDTLGIFRKSGLRSRIQKLKLICENAVSPDLVMFEVSQAYDVADMLKQYFRELPEPLLTQKLSETCITIKMYVPPKLVLECLQKFIVLLPDCNRIVLFTVLKFLHEISLHCDTNQMDARNLAVCFAPTLFHLSSRAASPTRRRKTIGVGLPSDKELKENRAAQEVLELFIKNYDMLFDIPADVFSKYRAVFDEHWPQSLSSLQIDGNYVSYLDYCEEIMLRENRDKWKGWITAGNCDGVELSTKKFIVDGCPLRLYRAWSDIDAPPITILDRILYERSSWDSDLAKWRVVSRLSENCEIFQWATSELPPHASRDYLIVRRWSKCVAELNSGCILVEASVRMPEVSVLGTVRATVFANRYLIEPCGSGRSRLTNVSRVDLKGRSLAWYSKVFGSMTGRYISRIRDSFRQVAEGPETKL